jgi:hypothetical protein
MPITAAPPPPAAAAPGGRLPYVDDVGPYCEPEVSEAVLGLEGGWCWGYGGVSELLEFRKCLGELMERCAAPAAAAAGPK